MEKKHLSDDFQINYYKYNIKLMNIKISRNDNSQGKKYTNMSTQSYIYYYKKTKKYQKEIKN